MRGFVWFGLGVLLFLAWGISYIVFQFHRKTRSRIMVVGFARDEIEERSRLGFCNMPFLASSYRPFSPRFHPTVG